MRLAARTSFISELSETLNDFIESFHRVALAYNLAAQDILTRYRGSVLGPWWITITVGALIVGIGTNYAFLFHQSVAELLPYVAVGVVVWGFISATISEGGESLTSSASLIRQTSLPIPLFVSRTIIRNLINLAHQLVIIVGVFVWFHLLPTLGALWSILGLVLIVVNLSWISLLLCVVSARFRDVPQIVTSSLQFIFFMSPIFWRVPPALEHSPFVAFNPFYFAVQMVREPLLSGRLPTDALLNLTVGAGVGWCVALLVYNQIRRRIVHYL